MVSIGMLKQEPRETGGASLKGPGDLLSQIASIYWVKDKLVGCLDSLSQKALPVFLKCMHPLFFWGKNEYTLHFGMLLLADGHDLPVYLITLSYPTSK